MLHTTPTGDTRAEIEQVLGIEADAAGHQRPKRRRRLWLALALMAALGGGYAWYGAASGGAGLVYRTEAVTRGDITVTVTATGTVEPTDQVSVSSELSGIVRRVEVDYNSTVRAGQLLAELDDDKLSAALASARADLLAARAKVKVAEATVRETEVALTRARTLVDRKIGTRQDLDTATAAYDRALAEQASAEAGVTSAEADVRTNETNLSKARIVSPVDGVVLARTVEPGQVVAASLQAPDLFTIAEDLTRMEVQVDVDEADIGKVREGQSATFSVDAYPGRAFEGKIAQVRYGSEVVQGVVTYKAVLTADNGDLALRPGMTATAEITVEEVADTLTVPNEALRYAPPVAKARDSGGLLRSLLTAGPRFRGASERSDRAATGERGVWVLKGGEAHKVTLKTGATDGQRTEVVEGTLAEGDQVIVDASAPKG